MSIAIQCENKINTHAFAQWDARCRSSQNRMEHFITEHTNYSMHSLNGYISDFSFSLFHTANSQNELFKRASNKQKLSVIIIIWKEKNRSGKYRLFGGEKLRNKVYTVIQTSALKRLSLSHWNNVSGEYKPLLFILYTY